MLTCSSFLKSYISETDGMTGNVEFTRDAAYFVLDNGLEFDINGWFCGEEIYDEDDFYYQILKTPYIGANQITSLRKSGAGTCGYIFPVSSIADPSLFPRDRWTDVYASQASRAIISGALLSDGLPIKQSLNRCVEDTLTISDFFPEDTAFLVAGKEQLLKYSLNENEILINLSKEGYYKQVFKESVDLHDFKPNVSIKNSSSSLLASDLDYMLRQIYIAHGEDNPRSRFLFLYQVIEILIAKIFDHEIVNLDYKDFSDSWTYREKLNAVTNEKYRISRIQEFYLDGKLSGENFNLVSRICSDMSFIEDEDSNWAHRLYKVRNVIVHSQNKLNDKDLDELVRILYFVQYFQ